jgi:hypothetical protein
MKINLANRAVSIVCYECKRRKLREQCFTEDEGWPLEVGLQERASNHLKLRGSRVRVVSVEEKAERNSVR